MSDYEGTSKIENMTVNLDWMLPSNPSLGEVARKIGSFHSHNLEGKLIETLKHINGSIPSKDEVQKRGKIQLPESKDQHAFFFWDDEPVFEWWHEVEFEDGGITTTFKFRRHVEESS